MSKYKPESFSEKRIVETNSLNVLNAKNVCSVFDLKCFCKTHPLLLRAQSDVREKYLRAFRWILAVPVLEFLGSARGLELSRGRRRRQGSKLCWDPRQRQDSTFFFEIVMLIRG